MIWARIVSVTLPAGRNLPLAICALLICAVSWADCVKVIAWKDKPPYLFIDTAGEVHGIHADLIREALRRMQCRIRFVDMPWVRALLELQRGEIDILPGAGLTPERERFAYFSRPTNFARNVLFINSTASSKYQLKTLGDIRGTDFRLGVTIKAAYGDAYDKLVDDPVFASRLVPIIDRIGGWKMMAAGRLEGQIADQLTGLVEIRHLGLEAKIQQTDLVLQSVFETDRVAFSKKSNSADFVSTFDKTLNAMIADGTYQSLFLKNFSCKLSMRKLGCE